MRHFNIIPTCFCLMTMITFALKGQSQQSEDFIPRDAVTVFSLNNITLLQKISLDDLIQYEFMEEIQSELFDGSTAGKTIKDSGIDFDQKLNVFFGKANQYEVSGFTFGIKDKKQLFTVFDDFDPSNLTIAGVEIYQSYFNHLLIVGNVGVLLRVDPLQKIITETTDSIAEVRGYDFGYGYQYGYFDESDYEEEAETEIYEDYEEEVLDETTYEEYDEILDEAVDFPLATESPLQKNYSEFRDSVEVVLKQKFLVRICTDLFVNKVNLKNSDLNFENQLKHDTEGIFYMDNSRNFEKAQGFWYFERMFPSLYQDVKELYTGNVMLGDLILNDNSLQFKVDAHYGPVLGSIYEKLNNTKFDKNVLKYIHKNSPAYLTYNVNLKAAYEEAYKIIIPLLEQEKNTRVSSTLLTLELMNEFINKDALFDTYKGSMFATFNGVRQMKTTKIEFNYDPNTFEYTEEEVEKMVDMPLFTFGFSTLRTDIPNLVLKHISRMTSQCKNMGNYWVIEDLILESAPLYIINKNGLFIFTNDSSLLENNANGYGKNSLSKKEAKSARNGGFVYAQIDWSKTLKELPKELFSIEQMDMLNAMQQKTGTMVLTSSKTNIEKTAYNLNYNFIGTYENSGKYLLDLINSLYIISK
jgi:hypothetical protein